MGEENGMAGKGEEDVLLLKIARILDEVRASNATHNRKLKELSSLRSRSSSILSFFAAFSKTLTPLLAFQRRTTSAERVVRFVSIFAANRDPNFASFCDEFLENFIKFLLVATAAANRTVRLRSCQIVSEIIMRLADDTEVSSELWDEVIECMKHRVGDKVPVVRTYAIRALSRFAGDSENSDILDLFLEVLPLEQNVEVRKTLLLSLPPSTTTSQVIIDCTLDVSESVRKAAYTVLANKFPLQSLSIKQRSIILQRGLSDRSPTVSKECLNLMKDEWLIKCCNGDVVEFLKFLDVETYELVGESVMEALLKVGLVKLHDGDSIQKYIVSKSDGHDGDSGECTPSIQLMEAEVALYWRTVCRHVLNEAQTKGTDAASTMGMEAEVYAAEASNNNDLLEKILPETISDYIELVKAHIAAGASYHFASRQLLLLGAILDFSDATNRKVIAAFVQELLHMPLECDVDDDVSMIVLGDGVSLGGDRDWAEAVSGLASKVHASSGEFEEVILGTVEELAQPCRERTATPMQWMHCLSVTGLLLEDAKSIRCFQGKALEPFELLHSLLLPGAKHVHFDVQRIAIRCLGLFGLLERKPSEELVKQLRISFIACPDPIRIMACKALIDLGMWHGPHEVDKAVGKDLSLQNLHGKTAFSPVSLSSKGGDLDVELLDLLYAGLVQDEWTDSSANDENESVQAVLGEGFAKMLLLSEKYPSLSAYLCPVLLASLINLFFNSETEHLHRLKQCLSVFFEHYPSLSATHKKFISEAFIPVMRSMWPGINGNAGSSSFVISSMRKRAVRASRFMLQMIQAPLYAKETEMADANCNGETPEVIDGVTPESPIECSEEGLAIRLTAEVASFQTKKTSAEKSYVSALCRILLLIHFGPSQQVAIKIMRRLLNSVATSVSAEKDLVRDLNRMAQHLKAIDKRPDMELLQDQANFIFGRLNLGFNLEVDAPIEIIQQTPAPRSTRPTRSGRRVRQEESSDEETSPVSVVPNHITGSMSTRSQRASKTAALQKIATNTRVGIDEDEHDEDEDENDEEDNENSDVTSEEELN